MGDATRHASERIRVKSKFVRAGKAQSPAFECPEARTMMSASQLVVIQQPTVQSDGTFRVVAFRSLVFA